MDACIICQSISLSQIVLIDSVSRLIFCYNLNVFMDNLNVAVYTFCQKAV